MANNWSDVSHWSPILVTTPVLFLKNKRRALKPFSVTTQKVTPHTSPKTNMDTQNDGLEKVTPFRIWPFLVATSMLDFWGVFPNIFPPKTKTQLMNHLPPARLSPHQAR